MERSNKLKFSFSILIFFKKNKHQKIQNKYNRFIYFSLSAIEKKIEIESQEGESKKKFEKWENLKDELKKAYVKLNNYQLNKITNFKEELKKLYELQKNLLVFLNELEDILETKQEKKENEENKKKSEQLKKRKIEETKDNQEKVQENGKKKKTK